MLISVQSHLDPSEIIPFHVWPLSWTQDTDNSRVHHTVHKAQYWLFVKDTFTYLNILNMTIN